MEKHKCKKYTEKPIRPQKFDISLQAYLALPSWICTYMWLECLMSMGI